MKKNTVRLTEAQLHRVIKESVKKIVNEINMDSFPYAGDSNQRNSWWKNQVDTDFPNHGIEKSSDWQSQYNNLYAKKQQGLKKVSTKELKAAKNEIGKKAHDEMLKSFYENRGTEKDKDNKIELSSPSFNAVAILDYYEGPVVYMNGKEYSWGEELEACENPEKIHPSMQDIVPFCIWYEACDIWASPLYGDKNNITIK